MSISDAPIRALSEAELVGFATALAGAQWPTLRPSPASSSPREYEEIWADEHVNAWLIRWSGSADTGFHDHHLSAAGIVVLEGALVECGPDGRATSCVAVRVDAEG